MNAAKALKEAEVEECCARERLGSGRFELATALDPILAPLGITREPGTVTFTENPYDLIGRMGYEEAL